MYSRELKLCFDMLSDSADSPALVPRELNRRATKASPHADSAVRPGSLVTARHARAELIQVGGRMWVASSSCSANNMAHGNRSVEYPFQSPTVPSVPASTKQATFIDHDAVLEGMVGDHSRHCPA